MRIAVILIAVLAPFMLPAQSPPAQVAVVGTDYAFIQFPSTLAAGPTFFSFENRGKVRHELSVTLLKPGVTLKDLQAKGPAAGSSRAMAESIIGLLVARPGESSGGQLFVTLLPGRRYLVICNLKDSTEAPRHAELGMVTTFDVAPSPPRH